MSDSLSSPLVRLPSLHRMSYLHPKRPPGDVVHVWVSPLQHTMCAMTQAPYRPAVCPPGPPPPHHAIPASPIHAPVCSPACRYRMLMLPRGGL